MLVPEPNKIVQALFEAAQRGDRQALDQFLTHLRPQILAACYRLLGNVDDAEDAAQEALLAILAGINATEFLPAWQPLVFGSAVAAGLLVLSDQEAAAAAAPENAYAMNESARARQVEPLLTGHMPLQEIDDLENFPARVISTRTSLALVFINLLQLLKPEVRAVYLLADLLGCDAHVVARAAQLTASQVSQHLAFARRLIEAARPKLPVNAMLLSHPFAARILRHFGKALIAQNAMRAVSVFDLDAVLVMPGIGSFTGHEAIATQLERMFMVGLAPQRISTLEINGQPALVCYQKKEEGRRKRYFANLVMAVAISEHAPNANQIVRVEVVTEDKMVQKIGETVRRVKVR